MSEKKKKIKLRPVIYGSSTFKKGAPETAQQLFLLKALKVTSDPKKLKEMMGVKSVADVYRTLDKIAMRKEYHEALNRSGISFDYLVGGIKDIADSGEKDGDRLKAFQVLLKSVGMEKYDTDGDPGSGTWEEILMQKIEEKKEDGDNIKQLTPIDSIEEYKVKEPKIPKEEKKAQEEEKELTSSIYDLK